MVLERPGSLVVREFDVPEINGDEALLRIERVSVCGSDLQRYAGRNTRTYTPSIPGHETVARVVELGANAADAYGVAPGDRVVVEPYLACGRCHPCLSGRYQMCAENRCYGVTLTCDCPPYLLGSYSEYMVLLPGSRIHKIAEDVRADAASLTSVVANGQRWVQTRGQARMHEPIVIMGSGAQGLAAVIASAEAGAAPIVVIGRASDAARFEIAVEFGADHTVNVDEEDAVAAISRITDGEMTDLVIECSGAPTAITAAIEMLRPGGRLVQIGTNARAVPITTDKIVRGELEIVGGLGQMFEVETAVKLVSTGKYAVEKMTSRTFPLVEAEQATVFALEHPDQCIRVALDLAGEAAA